MLPDNVLPAGAAPNDNPSFMNQAYKFEFIQGVPEPGSLLGLSAGLIGLSGLALHRRRT